MNAAIATEVAPTSYKRLCRNVQFAATAQIATEVAPTVNTTPPRIFCRSDFSRDGPDEIVDPITAMQEMPCRAGSDPRLTLRWSISGDSNQPE